MRIAIDTFTSDVPNQSRHSVSTSSEVVLKTFIRTLFTVNYSDPSWVLLTRQASMAYNKHGRHLEFCTLTASSSMKWQHITQQREQITMCVMREIPRPLQLFTPDYADIASVRPKKNIAMSVGAVDLCLIGRELLPSEVLHCGTRNFRSFGSCDLDLDPMTFIYELDP